MVQFVCLAIIAGLVGLIVLYHWALDRPQVRAGDSAAASATSPVASRGRTEPDAVSSGVGAATGAVGQPTGASAH